LNKDICWEVGATLHGGSCLINYSCYFAGFFSSVYLALRVGPVTLAKQIDWRGLNGKYAFEQLAIKDVVLSKLYLCFIVLINFQHYRKNIDTL